MLPMEMRLRSYNRRILNITINGKQVIVEIISGLFFVLFIYASTSKLINYDVFKVQMNKSPILTGFGGVLAWAVPALEIIVAILLMFSKTRLLGLHGALMLMSLFTAYIIAILNFSESIPCTCGGLLSAMDWDQHLIFNVLFMLFAFAGIGLQAQIIENYKRQFN